MSKNIKDIVAKFSLLVSSALLALLLCELLMRFIGMAYNIDFTLYMKELKNSDRLPQGLFVKYNNFWGLKPNVQVLATTSDFSIIYKINSHGLRDKEYDFKKPKNKIRILAVGDSLTFGEGVEYGDRFTEIIEKSFSNVEVINCGVPGYGLDQILIQFAADGIKYSPDFVIIFIDKSIIKRFSTDIIKDNHVNLENIIPKRPLNNVSTGYINRNDPFFNKRKDFLGSDRSFLFSFLKYKFSLFTLKNKLRKEDKENWSVFYSSSQKKVNITKDKTSDINIEPIAARTTLLIQKFNDISKKYNIKLIVINIDDYSDNLGFLRNIKNICYYDLSNELINESKRCKLRFVYDRHYNKNAHRFIGQKTTKFLEGIMLNRYLNFSR